MVQEGAGRKKTTQWVQINLLVLPTTQAGGQVVGSGVEGGTLAGAFFFMQAHSPSSFPCFALGCCFWSSLSSQGASWLCRAWVI